MGMGSGLVQGPTRKYSTVQKCSQGQGQGQGQGAGPIVFYCASTVPSTHPGPVPMQRELAMRVI